MPLTSQIMTKEAYTVNVETTVLDAVNEMNKNGRTELIVVKDSNPVGILTEMSLFRRFIPQNLPPDKVKVVEVMYTPLLTISPDVDAAEAARFIFKKKVTRLAVVDRGKLVGLLTLTDLAKYMSQRTFWGGHVRDDLLDLVRHLWGSRLEEI
ncbi:MAG: cyclic nucleotide-binding/CBS domain-containing protein [Candidatus Bathyarchaeia archaeon]